MAKPKTYAFLLSSHIPTLNAHPQGASRRTEAPSLGPSLLVLPTSPSLPVWLSPSMDTPSSKREDKACLLPCICLGSACS